MTTTRAPASYWADICRANLAVAKAARETETEPCEGCPFAGCSGCRYQGGKP